MMVIFLGLGGVRGGGGCYNALGSFLAPLRKIMIIISNVSHSGGTVNINFLIP